MQDRGTDRRRDRGGAGRFRNVRRLDFEDFSRGDLPAVIVCLATGVPIGAGGGQAVVERNSSLKCGDSRSSATLGQAAGTRARHSRFLNVSSDHRVTAQKLE